MLQSITIAGGASVEFTEAADFFRLLSAAYAVDVKFYREGREVADAPGVTGGYAERFPVPFDRVRISSATTQTIQFVERLGSEVFFDNANGYVTIQNVNGPWTQAQKTVTNASAELVAANASRRYLLVQNKSSSGILYLNFSGAAATAANGLKILPGGSYETAGGFAPSGSITAIGDIASNADVVVVEG